MFAPLKAFCGAFYLPPVEGSLVSVRWSGPCDVHRLLLFLFCCVEFVVAAALTAASAL